VQVERDCQRQVRAHDSSHEAKKVAIGIRVVVRDGGPVQREQQAVQGSSPVDVFNQLSRDPFETICCDRTSRYCKGGQQWNCDKKTCIGGFEKSPDFMMLAAPAFDQLRSTRHACRPEMLVISG
jgi:hypothetical protein